MNAVDLETRSGEGKYMSSHGDSKYSTVLQRPVVRSVRGARNVRSV